MSFNLVDSVKSLFTNDVVRRASTTLNESEGSIQKALTGIIPGSLLGIFQKATTGDAGSILNQAKQLATSDFPGNLMGQLTGAGTAGSGLLKTVENIFGGNLSSVASTIANFAGIRSSSASSLLGMATPASLGVLGKYATENNLNTSGFLSFLNEQKNSILNALPSGLNLAGLLGITGLGSKVADAGRSTVQSVRGAADVVEPPRRKWIVPFILGVAALLLLLYLARGCGARRNEAATIPTTDTAAAVPPAPTPARTDTVAVAHPVLGKVVLVTGAQLDAFRGGIEERLVAFLNDHNAKVSKDQWFDFDDLNFETNSAKITNESMRQVNNIAAIMKAYPKTKIKIGGYTDKTGDNAANKKLSQERAQATLVALENAGVNKSQLVGAEGYGSQFAKAAADAPDEERRKDRRISINVREKG
jgi:outer membrane protein OmpA-like peptidoglycan-associated protein